jgi:hypothetical protein
MHISLPGNHARRQVSMSVVLSTDYHNPQSKHPLSKELKEVPEQAHAYVVSMLEYLL